MSDTLKDGTDNRVLEDEKPPPPPPVFFAGYAVGGAAIVYILYTLWQWIVCGCA